MSSIDKNPEINTLYKAPYLQIAHLPDYHALFYKLIGYLEQEEARDYFEKILHFVSKTNSSSLLADLTDFKGAPQNLAAYINQVFTQKLSDIGVERVGMNRPKSGLGELSNRLAAGSSAREYLQVKEYTQMAEALRWIEAERKKEQS